MYAWACRARKLLAEVSALSSFSSGGSRSRMLVVCGVGVPAQRLRQIHKMAQGPNVEEGHHGALAASQIQAVVPVRPEALAATVAPHLLCGKVQNLLQMVVDGPFPSVSIAQHPEQAGRRARGQGQLFPEHGAVVIAFLKGAAAPILFHDQRVLLIPAGTDEGIPQALESVGLEGGGHELVGVLVEQLIVDDSAGIAAARTVQGHLEVLVVNGDLVVGELGVEINAEVPLPAGLLLQIQVPKLHILPAGDEQGLGRADA